MEQSIHVRITTDDEIIFQKDVTLEPDGSTNEDTGIDQKGEYEVTAETESGLENSATFSIGDFSLREGTDFEVGIYEDQIRILKEQ